MGRLYVRSNVCVVKTQLFPSEIFVFLYSGGDTINTSERQHGKCCNLRMQSRSHVLFIIQAEDDRQMCWTTRGVKVTDQWRATFAYTLEATTKTKAWLGHNFYAKPLRSPSVFCPVLPCPALPTPAPFSSPFNHCLHYLTSWMNCGSGLSLGSSAGPTLLWLPSHSPSLWSRCLPKQPHSTQAHLHSHAHKHTSVEQLHTHINWADGRVCNFCELLIYADSGAFCSWITAPSGHH